MHGTVRAMRLLFLLLALGQPGTASAQGPSRADCAPQAAEPATFPLTLKGTTLDIGPTLDRKALVAQIRSALAGEAPSILTAERLQYDYIAAEGEGPVSVLVDFDRKGRWEVIRVDSYLKQQNPVAQELAAWLTQHVGRGRKAGKDTIWRQGGMQFRLHEARDAGEDSTYGITIIRNRA
ncbi:hypothetical protein [Fundidesulfovibrio terrae]|uniref:hypothetical protein n=1 Tax=Fundidesulfovibrio terrae TaxID=2922866 RepID=UPI001FAF744D|nr:hypothetical protein [Fundidesulfovibrio terrae]